MVFSSFLHSPALFPLEIPIWLFHLIYYIDSIVSTGEASDIVEDQTSGRLGDEGPLHPGEAPPQVGQVEPLTG